MENLFFVHWRQKIFFSIQISWGHLQTGLTYIKNVRLHNQLQKVFSKLLGFYSTKVWQGNR